MWKRNEKEDEKADVEKKKNRNLFLAFRVLPPNAVRISIWDMQSDNASISVSIVMNEWSQQRSFFWQRSSFFVIQDRVTLWKSSIDIVYLLTTNFLSIFVDMRQFDFHFPHHKWLFMSSNLFDLIKRKDAREKSFFIFFLSLAFRAHLLLHKLSKKALHYVCVTLECG